jgi:polygalacturonase
MYGIWMPSITMVFVATLSGLAQDTRTVTEPLIPPSCTTLLAEKSGDAEKLAEVFEKTTDTARIQAALDACKSGMAVELAQGGTGNAFLTGSLDLRAGVTLLIDKGVTLYGSRDPKDYDPNPTGEGQLLCGTMSDVGNPYITAGGAAAQGDAAKSTTVPAVPPSTPPAMPRGRPCKSLITVNVKNAAIMGDGVIDGRGGAQVVGHDYTWWQMARAAEPKQLRYFSTKLITANRADGFILYRIVLHNAPNYHVTVGNTDGFTAWGVHLLTPTVRGTDTRNTDGIDPGSSTNITIVNSWIDNGDDNIAIKTGVTHMSVLNNHFYDGHGMSIGSETFTGDSFLLVAGLTEDGTTSGIRIKSNAARGGPVHDLTYENICMRNVTIPIAISPFYNNGTIEGFVDPGVVGDRIPDYKAITLRNIVSLTPGDVLIAGKDAAHTTEITLDTVTIQGIKPEQVHSQYTHAAVAHVNFDLKGTAVVVSAAPALPAMDKTPGASLIAIDPKTKLGQCVGAFPPMQ